MSTGLVPPRSLNDLSTSVKLERNTSATVIVATIANLTAAVTTAADDNQGDGDEHRSKCGP